MDVSQDLPMSLERSYWLAARGTQQMDLALRFVAAAQAQGQKVLALKGISIADELYGGVQNRPMADIDFLVVETPRFETVAELARSLGLLEVGSSDHALAFKEPSSGVILELHVSLTACPGLFPVDHDGLWSRRIPVSSTPMSRLSDPDLIVHLALHTAFQHALAANEYHYGDFVRALEVLKPSPARLLETAGDWGALKALGLMTLASRRRTPESPALADLESRVGSSCPGWLIRWLDSQTRIPPPPRIASMGLVRYGLAPSKWRYVARTLFPRPIPGRTLPRPKAWRRLVKLIDAGLFPPSSERPNLS